MPPAARVADPTTHGAPLAPGPGSTNVKIGGQFAWRTVIDQHACPATSVSGADGVGSVLMGSPTVWINNQMACRQNDIVMEKPGLAMGPADPILLGCPTVVIGGPTATVTIAAGIMQVTWGGFTANGGSNDVIDFLSMVAGLAANSNSGRALMATITGDTAHPIVCGVGRGQPNVIVDNFGTNGVGVDDLEQYSAAPRAGHPNESTRGELIAHFLAERHDAAANGNAFPAAHQAGIAAQNQVRAENGQSPVTSQVFAGTDAAGNTIGRTNYADGTHQDAHIDPNGNITRVDPP